MRTSARSMVLALTASLLALPLLAASPAAADPVPTPGAQWPRCHTGTDTDGQYCIESATKDGDEVYTPDGAKDGLYELPEVDLLGPGEVRFGVELWQVVDGQLSAVGGDSSIDPTPVWQITANVGPIDLIEMQGKIRDPQLTFGGNATDGYTFTLTFKPTPMAVMEDYQSCSFVNGCGGDSTVATLVYDGFASGKLTDDSDMTTWTPAQIERRRGYISTFNAHEASWHYDYPSNALVVEMANPHLKALGEPATGFFDVVVPDALLVNEYSVPDPTALTAGSFSVKRAGSTEAVDFVVTRVTGGVRLKIDDISFSTPWFTIRPKASVPGAPRWGSVTRPQKRTVKVTFRRPVADGGKAITTYRVQCGRGVNVWTTKVHRVTPAFFPDMPRKAVTCKMRGVNSVGAGPWSSVKQG